MRTRSYSELLRLSTFEERFEYLSLTGVVGAATFGSSRWVNQRFYTSPLWKRVRDEVIVRDNGCDLGVAGYDLHAGLLVHHMNPMTEDDVIEGEEWILDPEFLITTSQVTHNAIHFGNGNQPHRPFVQRARGDTRLW